ncbi:hypothetical protein E3G68_005054 [Mycobacteroides abscessus]|uniref:hypothetical protein n=1 Tax=Mycobacteroides abscessus TaxID=36809 RepID=UPI0018782922|nr:hypothetical protein [Mycobacteroides abscessus]
MTDLLEQLLADPELLEWPRFTTPPADDRSGAPNSFDMGPAEMASPMTDAGSNEHESAVEKLRSYIDETASTDPSPGTTEFGRLGFDAPAADAGAVDADLRNTGDQYAAEPTADSKSATDAETAENTEEQDSAENDEAPLAFDDIAAKNNVFSSGVGAVGQWLKNQNWKSPRTLGVTAASVIAAAVVGQWMLQGSGDQTPTAKLTTPATSHTAAPAAPAAPADGPVQISTATARCPAPSSDPMNALRVESTQPWICVRAWQIDGQILEVTFDKAYVISAVSTMPGADSEEGGQDQWAKFRTVRLLNWSFNDVARTNCDQDTRNERKTSTLEINAANCYHQGPWQPVVASSVTITIRHTDQPSNPNSLGTPTGDPSANADYTAFAVSHLEIIGHPSGG